jgi:tyrosyl-tRNA synthetase
MDTEKLLDELSRTVDQAFSLKEFREKLASGKPLRIKYGADATAPFLHLGHAVNLFMMRKMQESGHKVIFLLGDFTTRIGDPTGKSESRPVLGQAEIDANAGAFLSQVGKVLITDDPELFECRRNSEWYERMGVAKFLGLLSGTTHARLIGRDMFKRRIENVSDIFMHELVYPVLQGWDSVELRSDLTIVGSDQLFNEMMGRQYQERNGQCPQVVITSKITPGLDGVNKQSKSLNNYVAIDDSPRDKFGKVMSLADGLILQWMEVYTEIALGGIKQWESRLAAGENPRAAKLALASAIVGRWHGPAAAREEAQWFEATFSRRSFPEDARTVTIPAGGLPWLDALSLALPEVSRSELRRLIKAGAVRTEELGTVTSAEALVMIEPGKELRLSAGKKNFFVLRA